MSNTYQAEDRHGIRQYMRRQRNALTDQMQLEAAKRLSQNVLSQPWYQRAKNIAVYLANDGEIDPIVFTSKALFRGKSCFLPSLHPIKKGQLWFGDYQGAMIKNRFDISEPDPKQNSMLNAKQLDLVFMPLVAFDNSGGRLGMGGGFYDRTFEFLTKQASGKPKLIGLAHHFQQVEQLPIESWDVPLSAIITDQGVIKVK